MRSISSAIVVSVMALTHLQMGRAKRARPSEERLSSPVRYNDTEALKDDVEATDSKRPRMRKGISYENIITTPRRSPSAPQISPNSHSDRTRVGLRGRTKVNYDMRFHPADKILRPNYPATKAACQTSEGSESDTAADEDPGEDHDDEAKERSQSPSSSPKCEVKGPEHRSTRTGRQVKVANYDMKHHPMDDVLRPKAAARRSVRFSGLPSSPQRKFTKAETTTKSTPASSPIATFDNPFTKSIPEDWYQLSDFDRRLYQLQDAAPLGSMILPLRWPEVVKQLIEENLLSSEQLGACGGYVALQTRYEDVRVAVKASFGPTVPDEPKTTGELIWMRAEDFDVFDSPSGKKYWRHKHDSFVAKGTHEKSKIDLSHFSEEGTEGKAPINAAKFEDLPAPALEGIVEEQISLPEADDTLMQTMRNEISATVQNFMSEDEVDQLISRHDEIRFRPIDYIASGPFVNASNPASTSSDDHDLPLSPNAPPGVKRAALRLRKTKRAQEKLKMQSMAEKKLKEQHSLHKDIERSSKTTKPALKTPPRYQFSGVIVEKSRPSLGEVSSSITSQALPKTKTIDKKRTQLRDQFRVHEDQPDHCPLSEGQTFAYPESPGTDLPKENLTEDMLDNTANNVQSSPIVATHGRPQLAATHPSYMSHTPSPTTSASAPSTYQTILGSPNTTIPALPPPTYPADPTVTMFTPINRGRPRPVVSDFYSH